MGPIIFLIMAMIGCICISIGPLFFFVQQITGRKLNDMGMKMSLIGIVLLLGVFTAFPDYVHQAFNDAQIIDQSN